MNTLILIILAVLVIVIVAIIWAVKDINSQIERYEKEMRINEEKYNIILQGIKENTDSIHDLRKTKAQKTKTTTKNESKRKAN